MARCRKASFEGALPEISLPFQSSLDRRAGSSLPRLDPVGVSSQPSAQRTLMLPVDPCVRPRSKIDLPSSQSWSRSWCSCMLLLQLRERLLEEIRAAEVARLECQRQRRIVEAFGPGDAGVDLRTDAQPAHAERADHGAGGF